MENLLSYYASYSLIFSPLHGVINWEQHKKYLYNQPSHYRVFDRLCTHPSYQFISDCVAWLWCITMLHFQLPQTHWVTFQAKNSIRSTLDSTALTQVSHRSHNACTANRHLCGKEERNGAQIGLSQICSKICPKCFQEFLKNLTHYASQSSYLCLHYAPKLKKILSIVLK